MVGKEDRERGGSRRLEYDLGCVGKEHRRGIIHLQGIILFLAGLLLETRARVLFLRSPLYLPRLLLLYSAAGKIVAWNSQHHCLAVVRTDKQTERQTKIQKRFEQRVW